MLETFQMIKVGFALFFIDILYHGNALFSSARVRVCEEN